MTRSLFDFFSLLSLHAAPLAMIRSLLRELKTQIPAPWVAISLTPPGLVPGLILGSKVAGSQLLVPWTTQTQSLPHMMACTHPLNTHILACADTHRINIITCAQLRHSNHPTCTRLHNTHILIRNHWDLHNMHILARTNNPCHQRNFLSRGNLHPTHTHILTRTNTHSTHILASTSPHLTQDPDSESQCLLPHRIPTCVPSAPLLVSPLFPRLMSPKFLHPPPLPQVHLVVQSSCLHLQLPLPHSIIPLTRPTTRTALFSLCIYSEFPPKPRDFDDISPSIASTRSLVDSNSTWHYAIPFATPRFFVTGFLEF